MNAVDQQLAYAGIGLAAGGFALLVLLAVRSPDGPLYVAGKAYIQSLDNGLKFLFAAITGAQIVQLQLLVAFLLVTAAVALSFPIVLAPLVILPAAPRWILEMARRARVAKIESQIDRWLLMLANMLKTTASLGDALLSSQRLIRAPLSQEIDLVLKEIHLGTPPARALDNMKNRVGSRLVSGALTTLILGHQTGGDLPRLLETTAGSLRDLTRLQGMLAAKTSEGRMQMGIFIVLPVVILYGFQAVEPAFFEPLLKDPMGPVIIGISTVLWLAAIIMAQRILSVKV